MHTLEPRQRSQYHDQNRKMWKCVGGGGWKSLQAAAYHVAQEYAVYWAMLTDTQRVIPSSLCLLGSHTRWLLPSVPSTTGRAEDHVLAYKVRYSFLSKKKKGSSLKRPFPVSMKSNMKNATHLLRYAYPGMHLPRIAYVRSKPQKPCQVFLPTAEKATSAPKQEPVLLITLVNFTTVMHVIQLIPEQQQQHSLVTERLTLSG